MKLYKLDRVLNFGKHKAKTLLQVFDESPSYVDFCFRELNHFAITEETLGQLQHLNPNYTFTEEALASVHNPDDIDSEENEPPPGYRNDPEYYAKMKRMHPGIADDERTDYWIDLADHVVAIQRTNERVAPSPKNTTTTFVLL